MDKYPLYFTVKVPFSDLLIWPWLEATNPRACLFGVRDLPTWGVYLSYFFYTLQWRSCSFIQQRLDTHSSTRELALIMFCTGLKATEYQQRDGVVAHLPAAAHGLWQVSPSLLIHGSCSDRIRWDGMREIRCG